MDSRFRGSDGKQAGRRPRSGRGSTFTLLRPGKCFHSLMRPAKPASYPDTGRESTFNCAGWTPAFAGVTVNRPVAVPGQVGEVLSLSYARGSAFITLMRPAKSAPLPRCGTGTHLHLRRMDSRFRGSDGKQVGRRPRSGRGSTFTLLCPGKCFHSLTPGEVLSLFLCGLQSLYRTPDAGRESIFNHAGWTPAFAGVTVSGPAAVPDQVGEMLSLSYARGDAFILLCGLQSLPRT